jgi:L-aspartate oxidase
MQQSDILVIGSGIAGLTFAIKAAQKHTVNIVTKRNLEESNTNYSQGGIAAVVSAKDSVEDHIKDTVQAGAGLCHPDVVRKICTHGASMIHELKKFGVPFSLSDTMRNISSWA